MLKNLASYLVKNIIQKLLNDVRATTQGTTRSKMPGYNCKCRLHLQLYWIIIFSSEKERIIREDYHFCENSRGGFCAFSYEYFLLSTILFLAFDNDQCPGRGTVQFKEFFRIYFVSKALCWIEWFSVTIQV